MQVVAPDFVQHVGCPFCCETVLGLRGCSPVRGTKHDLPIYSVWVDVVFVFPGNFVVHIAIAVAQLFHALRR